jgi:CRISPR-associated endonuclease/helicase Cas3
MLYAKSAGTSDSGETLLDHSLRVASMIRQLFARLPTSGEFDAELLAHLEAAAAFHDVGKAATGFQDMLLQRAADWKGRRHEFLSAAFAAAIGACDEVVFAVLTHHKRIPDSSPFIDPHSRLQFHMSMPDAWEPIRREFEANRSAVRELWATLTSILNRPDLLIGSDAPLEATFLPHAWRDARKQRKSIPAASRKRASLIRGLLISADHLASGKQTLAPVIDLKQFNPRFTLRPFQSQAAVRGNVILRAPTGSGKTEAALIWAAHNQGQNGRLFYSLPYTAALNAMHSRLRTEFPSHPESIGLLHGKAAHHLFEAMQIDFPGDPAKATTESKARASLAREMYHSVRVCTPHQLLRFTLRGKGWEQLLSEIPGACVVFDEVHSYDPALAGLTLGTARLFHQMGAKLMFISATLPRFLERIIAGLVPCETVIPDGSKPGDGEVLGRRRHTIRVADDTLNGLLPSIVNDAKAGATVLIVCNHVRSAQSIAEELRAKLGAEAICLFHSRFNMRDRSKIERSLSNSALPRVLVATQVVEVSLDISYQTGYFEAAPIDALTQRMGRVNRKGFDAPAHITVATQPLNRHVIYDSVRTGRTLDLLRLFSEPISEQDLTEICDEVYGDGYEAEELKAFNERLDHKYFTRFDEYIVAGDHESWTETAITDIDNRIDVLPSSLLDEFRLLQSERRWLEADALTVNVYRSDRLKKQIRMDHDPCVIDDRYARYTANGLEL